MGGGDTCLYKTQPLILGHLVPLIQRHGRQWATGSLAAPCPCYRGMVASVIKGDWWLQSCWKQQETVGVLKMGKISLVWS